MTAGPLALRLLLVTLSLGLVPAASARRADSTRAAQGLVEKILAAHGGRAALDKVTAYRMEGHIVTFREGRQGPTRRLWQRSGNLRVELMYPGAIEVRIVRGADGWRCLGGECESASGPMLDAMVLQAARAGAPWVLMDHAKEARPIAPLAFHGHDLPGIEVPLGDGLTLRLYADPATNRIAVSRGVLTHGGVAVPFGTDFSDYRAVSGVWFAFGEENFASGAHTGTTTIEKIEIGPTIAPGDFAAPARKTADS